VDIVGGAVFPPVSQLNYLLTLPPYAFYWFALVTQASLPPRATDAPAPLPEYATIVLRSDIAEVLAPTGRAILEREALPAYLQKRRWFGSKGEKLTSVKLAYAVKIGEGLRASLLTEVEANIAGRLENYTLPLGVCSDDHTSGPLAQQLAVTRVRRAAVVGYLTDAFALDAFTRAVIDALRSDRVLTFPGGRLIFRKSDGLNDLVLQEDMSILRLSAEQSNSSLIVDEKIVLKIVRKVLSGRHPEAEMTGYLTGRGFRNIAPLLGEVVRYDEDDTPHTIMLAQGFVRNQGDAWAWTLDYLKRISGEIAAEDDEAAFNDALGGYLALAVAIGRRLAEMHAVLAADTETPEFQSAPADEAAVNAWAAGVVEQIDLAVQALERVVDWADEKTRAAATRFVAQADALRAASWRLAGSAANLATQTRVHGDFHLGQVLVTPGDATLIDFEGEPAKTMQQRRAKSSPFRDVAGLLRSFDYAAATALAGRLPGSDQAVERQNLLVEQFRVSAGRAFLDAYLAVLHAAPKPWVQPAAEAALLDLFLLEKAAYEIRYEAANRPGWIGIPLAGVSRVAARLVPAQEEMV
jgi:maltose alpha-D-glucosyltransferase/alpha-amylase